MTRYMDITPAMLSEPSRTLLARIEAWMLWPSELESREREQLLLFADARAIYDAAVELRNEIGADGTFPMKAGELETLLARMLIAPGEKEILQAAKAARIDGTAAGHIVCDFLRSAATQEVASGLDEAKKFVKGLLERHFKFPHVESNSTINTRIWGRYRCVAHFWAASLVCRKDGIFPCSLDDVVRFLAVAETIRVVGESLKSSAKAGPVFEVSEMIRIPEEISLPRYAIEWFPRISSS